MYIRTPAKLCSSGCSGFFGLLCLAPSVATLVVHFRFRLPVVSDGGSCKRLFHGARLLSQAADLGPFGGPVEEATFVVLTSNFYLALVEGFVPLVRTSQARL